MSENDSSPGTLIALPPEGLKNIPRINTTIIGPIRVRATRPKLSSSDVLSPRIDVNPSPRAITKGTKMGPVVTAPDSQAIERNSLPVKPERINAIR